MNFNDCFQLGQIVKTHGTNGEIVCLLDVDKPAHYNKMESILVNFNQKLIPFFVQKCTIRGNHAVLKLEDIDSVEAAGDVLLHDVYLPLTQLPKLNNKQYYFHELEGYRVVDKQLGELGVVEQVVEMPKQAVLIMNYLDKEVMFPLVDQIFIKIDRTSRHFHVNLPDGLLDIYLNT